jgi:hypothetical protein
MERKGSFGSKEILEERIPKFLIKSGFKDHIYQLKHQSLHLWIPFVPIKHVLGASALRDLIIYVPSSRYLFRNPHPTSGLFWCLQTSLLCFSFPDVAKESFSKGLPRVNWLRPI